MAVPPTPPLHVSTARCEPLDSERLSLRLDGIWREIASAGQPLMLIVDAGGQHHRFPAVPRPRQAVGAAVPRFEARFTLPAALADDLDGRMTLLVGDAAVTVPALQRPAPAAPEDPASSEDPGLLAPLREELAQRARVEARLRGEVAALQARVAARGPVADRLEDARRELADELVRVRNAVEAHEQRRGEVESRAMVLAAELSEAQHHSEELQAQLRARQEECQALRGRVAELEAEVAEVRREAGALRTAELSARAGHEAALAEVRALHDELERLAGGEAAQDAPEAAELERAEALLAEARALTDSLQ